MTHIVNNCRKTGIWLWRENVSKWYSSPAEKSSGRATHNKHNLWIPICFNTNGTKPLICIFLHRETFECNSLLWWEPETNENLKFCRLLRSTGWKILECLNEVQNKEFHMTIKNMQFLMETAWLWRWGGGMGQ